MASANNVNFVLSTIVAFYIAGIYGKETSEIGPGDARFGIPIASTQVVNNMTMNPSDMANQFLQSIPGMKLSILSSIAAFLSPVLQGLLLTSLILFALTGTAAVICQMIDCSSALAGINSNGHSGFVAATHVAPLAGFHHHFNSNPTGNPYSRRRLGLVQRKPWLSAPPQPALTPSSVEDTLDKFDEN